MPATSASAFRLVGGAGGGVRLGRSLRRWMRGETLEGHAWRDNLTFWGGLLLLLAASTALEWSRLYRLETHLPGHAGGVLGYCWARPVWAGWASPAPGCWASAVVLGLGLVFRFSWGTVAETLGAHRRPGASAAAPRKGQGRGGRPQGRPRARDVLDDVHRRRRGTSPSRCRSSPGCTAGGAQRGWSRSARSPVHRDARQQAAAGGPAGRRAGAGNRVAETLEMTSRLIEKKLKDFGVEVRVVRPCPAR
jgi:S-DNA-T family DNA segregation ATPase FtsK/SpoIIIE